MEQRECSETLAHKIQTPGNYPEESIQHSEHCRSLKSSMLACAWTAIECLWQSKNEMKFITREKNYQQLN